MRRKSHKQNRKAGTGRLVTAIPVGGMVGATVGWLTALATGAKTHSWFRGELMSARDRAEKQSEIWKVAPTSWQKRSAMEMNSED